jgi:hypothetical protein
LSDEEPGNRAAGDIRVVDTPAAGSPVVENREVAVGSQVADKTAADDTLAEADNTDDDARSHPR